MFLSLTGSNFKLLSCNSARVKGLKVYSEKEIAGASSEMEKRYRLFWNDKGNQLCREPATKNKTKSTLHGIIDVSWTLRKTEILESMVSTTLSDIKALMGKDDIDHGRKIGRAQKTDTMNKNLERMRAAHAGVVALDEQMKAMKNGKTTKRDLVVKQSILDGEYTELKRAQEALMKSIKIEQKNFERKINDEPPVTKKAKLEFKSHFE